MFFIDIIRVASILMHLLLLLTVFVVDSSRDDTDDIQSFISTMILTTKIKVSTAMTHIKREPAYWRIQYAILHAIMIPCFLYHTYANPIITGMTDVIYATISPLTNGSAPLIYWSCFLYTVTSEMPQQLIFLPKEPPHVTCKRHTRQ